MVVRSSRRRIPARTATPSGASAARPPARAARRHHGGAEGEALEHGRAAVEAPVDHDGGGPPHRVGDRGQASIVPSVWSSWRPRGSTPRSAPHPSRRRAWRRARHDALDAVGSRRRLLEPCHASQVRHSGIADVGPVQGMGERASSTASMRGGRMALRRSLIPSRPAWRTTCVMAQEDDAATIGNQGHHDRAATPRRPRDGCGADLGSEPRGRQLRT